MKDLGSKYDSVGRHGEEPIVSVDMFHGTSLCEIVAILLQEVLPIHLHSDFRIAERLHALSPYLHHQFPSNLDKTTSASRQRVGSQCCRYTLQHKITDCKLSRLS